MSQPAGRKVKEFAILINQYYSQSGGYAYPGSVFTRNSDNDEVGVTGGYALHKEVHSLQDALIEIRTLLNQGHSLSKIHLMRRVVINSEFNLNV